MKNDTSSSSPGSPLPRAVASETAATGEVDGGLSLCSSGVNPRKVELLDEYAEGESLLDVGCGNGLYPVVTKHRFARVLQVDVVDRRDEQAKELDFRQMDARGIGGLAESFSTVACFDIIEHLDDDEGFLSALRGICDGVVIGSVPNEDDAQPQRVGLTYMHHTDKTHRRNYSPAVLRAKLRACGFTSLLIVPQYAEGLVDAAYALRTDTLISRMAARLIASTCRCLCRVGIFRNQSIADWFFVAR